MDGSKEKHQSNPFYHPLQDPGSSAAAAVQLRGFGAMLLLEAAILTSKGGLLDRNGIEPTNRWAVMG